MDLLIMIVNIMKFVFNIHACISSSFFFEKAFQNPGWTRDAKGENCRATVSLPPEAMLKAATKGTQITISVIFLLLRGNL